MNVGNRLAGKLTGIELLDRAIPQEHNLNGVHALLGPSGSGVTKISCMIVSEGIRQVSKNSSEGECGKWVFVSRQTRESDLHLMMECYLGRLNLDRMEFGHIQCLNPDDDPDMKLEFAKSILKKHFIYIDANKFPSGGWRTPEKIIADQLRSDLSGKPLAGLMIDDVPSIIDSWQSDSNNPGPRFTRLMNGFLAGCRKLAKENDCPLWIGHQIRGALSNESPRALITHHDAMHYKGMEKYITTSFVIGKHNDMNVFQIRCTKPYLECNKLLPVVRFGGGGTHLEEVDDRCKKIFLTDPWKQPSLLIHSDVLDLINNDREMRLRESRKADLAARMVRAIDLND